ncbi:possible amino acid/metabolite permease [Janibacter sp. HTCC2649]|uniref:amino acid permease n=1 Tax=Janibacter sp. HTCC2649 TaxID=313589 RepID=UPI0000671000|nr:amino acid permease [Janibacter sp. HTCC2649]EAP97653.1 possible amino acid/metabolite permease [Janibacter sp. HTCC2649]
MSDVTEMSDDERRLAELGYKQELHRSWSGFSNFAISFSIISILAGCFTTFGQAWSNGGPVAISWGWPLISVFILIIGFTMSELVSAYPTSGGIYWWAAKLGGPAAGFFTGWLNLIGLIAVTASVAYGAANFVDIMIGLFSEDYAANWSLTRVFIIFVVILVLAAVVNIFSSHLLAVINNVSVWWHVAGAAIVILILVFVPDHHQDLGFVFTERINNSGYAAGSASGATYWFLVLPLGFLLTQYTITGFDASAHLSEETQSASNAAAKGIWRSIAYSAVGGWFLLLALLFAVQDKDAVTTGINQGLYGSDVILGQSLSTFWHATVIVISAFGQLFCATACLTSASRMGFAFSRDGAIPGSRIWAKVTERKVPANAVMGAALVAGLITLPALIEVNFGTEEAPIILPTAFYAVVSVAVIGLYLAFLIPIWLRWKMGDAFVPGSWNNGQKYKWMNLVAVAEIAIICVYFILPLYPSGWPGHKDFAWKFVNYAPILTIGSLILLAIWWQLSARKWFTGPKHTIDKAVIDAFTE